MKRIMSQRWGIVACTLAALVYAARASADPNAALHSLGAVEENAYVAQRGALLESHPEPWDVEKACAYSWEAGLAAYILNGRLAAPEQYATWDVEVERASKAMHVPTPAAGLRNVRVALPFRLEFAWKPPAWVSEYRWGVEGATPSPRACARAGALNSRDSFLTVWPEAPLALWRTLWRNCDLAEFRAIAIGALGRSDSPDDQQACLNALFDAGETLEVRLQAIWACADRNAADSVDVLIRIVSDPNAPSELGVTALGFLGRNLLQAGEAHTRARTFLERVAMDSARPESLRCAALQACKRDSDLGDIAVFRAALMQSDLPELQRTGVFGDERLRPNLKHAMYNYGDLSVVSAATSVLLSLHNAEDVEFVRAYVDDATVAEDARGRANNALYRFEEQERIAEEKERDRQERIRSGKSYEQWWKEQMEQRERAGFKWERERIMSRADPKTGELTVDDAARLRALDDAEREFEERIKEEAEGE